MQSNKKSYTSMALAAIVMTFVYGCGDKNKDADQQNAPPPEVGVYTVSPTLVDLKTELPGRLEASRVAEVRARVAGILLKRLFVEGSDVKEGQPLFQIDDAPYQAALERAKASVAQAQASLAQTRAQADRYKPLVQVNAVSKQDYDNAVAAQKVSEANLAAARAEVTTSELNVGYAAVTAPISGRIGRALVTEGALVGQNSATELAIIQQIDPLYVNFTQSATEALQLKAGQAKGELQPGTDATQVEIVLEDGSVYPIKGDLLFEDLTVDETSGQVTLRATLSNPNKFLLPGLYVRVRYNQAAVQNAILLPQQAVTRTERGDTVMVVKDDNTLESRHVTLGPSQGNKWVVLDGLKENEKVMVDGFQKLPPAQSGQPVRVNPVPWQEDVQQAGSVHAGGSPDNQPTAAPAAEQ